MVVPSPTSSSWVLEISIKILAAGLSTCIDLRIVAPSLVTVMALFLGPDEIGTRILSIPLGPRVVLTRSATAIAPTKDDYDYYKERYQTGDLTFFLVGSLFNNLRENVLSDKRKNYSN